MTTMVFVNFPVSDIEASTSFYEKIGFKKNPNFSDELVSCMIWDENFFIMLLSRARYKTFIGEKEKFACPPILSNLPNLFTFE